MKSSNPCLLALTAMVLALGSAGAEKGMVLCFGGNGHVAIEAGGPGGCSNAAKAVSQAASAVTLPLSSSHCGACVDVALTPAATIEVVSGAVRLRSTPPAIPIAAQPPEVARERASVWHRLSIRTTFEKPHTVVIRC